MPNRNEDSGESPVNPKGCKGRWKWAECSDGCGHGHAVWCGGCGKRICPRCAQAKSYVSAAKHEIRFDHAPFAWSHLQETILTVPLHLRRQVWRAPSWWRDCLREWIVWARAKLGMVFAYARTHPAGDEDPRQWAPHAEVLWLRLPGWRGLVDVDAAREKWGGIIGAEVDEQGKRIVNVWCRFIDRSTPKGIGELRQKFQYVERPFAGWEHPVLRGAWYGAFPRVKIGASPWYGLPLCPLCEAPMRLRPATDSEKHAAEEVATAAPRAPPA